MDKIEGRESKVAEPLLMISGVMKGLTDQELTEKLLRGKVDIDSVLHYVEEYLGLAMCYRCCRFGHIAKHCRAAEVCHRCGGGHDGQNCGQSTRKCINCYKMFGKVREHSAGDSDCPAMKDKIKSEIPDVIMIQEPYQNFTGFFGYDTFRIGDRVKVITLIRQGVGRAWMRREISYENVMVVVLEGVGSDGDMLMVNVYDEPPDARNAQSRFRDLSGWLESRRERILMAGDFNGKNVAWGGTETDERGEEILEWTVMHGWNIENSQDDPPSFSSNRGRSWVDLVLSKGVKVKDIIVDREEESLSDHYYISYGVEFGKIAKGKGRWRYEGYLEERGPAQQRLGVEERGALLQGAVQEACRRELSKRKKRRRRLKDWCTDELTHERREVRRARKDFQIVSDDDDDRDRLRREYLVKTNAYKHKIKAVKMKAMEEELEEMGDRVWEICKRWVKGGKREVKENMRREDGSFTGTVEETYEELVRKYFPEDRLEDDEAEHGEIRREY
ncbi:uncharacterized protein LOC108915741 [Anoplophora glabripennis]|uniref:uncharacterized protein LOC108915741 n=1 Tax=Anoplophora glabripennis TaxID=217634 RepID=UPI000874D8D1|nr:uncharacterized protein LOC108915741 [Anoplophora glabripennis]